MTGRHVLLPDMSYACGGSILTKEGGFVVGTSPWGRVTCPACREQGQERLSALVRHLQGLGGHPDAVRPLDIGLASLSGGLR